MVSDGESLLGLCFDGQRRFSTVLPPGIVEGSLPVFDMTARWLDIYFGGNEPDFMPPLNMQGTDFRQAVWKMLLDIPYGKTMTYGAIAEVLAKRRGIAKMSAQAVGGAVGWNPICIIVPCHRVVGSNNSLTGYGGGIKNKILSRFTANAIGRPVYAGPVEATAIGNLSCQLIALGEVSGIDQARDVIRNSFPIEAYQPVNTAAWDAAYEKLLDLQAKA